MLSIDDYKSAESQASSTLPYPAVRAFRPAAFNRVGFPAEISDEQQLVWFVDIMNETANREAYLKTERYSEHEIALMETVIDRVHILCERLFGRRIHPFMSLLRSVEMYRFANLLARATSTENPSVLEIGPGSGYLGALFIQDKTSYHAMDNTQSLYLWQNRLFEELAKERFDETAEHECLEKRHPESVTHIPHWHFARLYAAEKKPRYDVIVCDRAFGEMDTWAARYIVNLAREMLAGSKIGALVFSHIGEPLVTTRDALSAHLAEAGFTHYEFENERPVSRSTLNAYVSPLADATAIDALKQVVEDGVQIPPHTSRPNEKLRAAIEFLDIRENELQSSYDFLEFLGVQRDWKALSKI